MICHPKPLYTFVAMQLYMQPLSRMDVFPLIPVAGASHFSQLNADSDLLQ